jgi:hypothetical protein
MRCLLDCRRSATITSATAPDEITWSHAEGLAHYAGLLKRITDMAFNEGDHAE